MKTNKVVLFLALAVILASCNVSERQLDAKDTVFVNKRDFVINDTLSKIKPVFIPLPAGAVRPEGWIKDWAVTSSNGIAKYLDEWSISFNMAWKGVGFEAEGVDPETGMGWPLEQSSYWLDGTIRLAYILNDSVLMKKISERLDMVVDGVLNGGKSFVYWQDVDYDKKSFDNWAHSHMGRALVAYYEASGNPRILEALVKVYSNFNVVPVPFQNHGVSGCTNVDPMLATYELSGDKRILDAVLAMAENPITKETVDCWNKGNIMNGHGVIAYENFRIPAMMYPYTNNFDLLTATQRCFDWLDVNHLQPHGIASTEEHTAGKGSTRNTETCNVAVSAWSYQQLYEITGEGRLGDKIERVFFNAAPVPVSRDFMTMAYYQSPNRVGEQIPLPSDRPGHPLNESSYVYRPTGHSVVCCVGNLTRVIPNYIMHMWMATTDKGIAATLYGPSVVNTIVGDNIPVEITTKTNYPFQHDISMTVAPSEACEFPVYLRIPEWTKNAEIKLNGESISVDNPVNGFIKINRKWTNGDVIDLSFPMQVEINTDKETTYPKTDYFLKGESGGRALAKEDNLNNPFRTVSYGPLLFALPLKDIDANQQEPNEKWNYALATNDASSVKVTQSEMPAFWSWQIGESPLKLTIKAKTFEWKPTSIVPLPKTEVDGIEETEIELVPYACTKFRISMFPIAKD